MYKRHITKFMLYHLDTKTLPKIINNLNGHVKNDSNLKAIFKKKKFKVHIFKVFKNAKICKISWC